MKIDRIRNLGELLAESSRRYWYKKAIIGPDRVLSYRRFKKETDLITGGLIRSLRVSKGDKIAVLLSNTSWYPVVFFSILKAGAVVVPVNIFLKPNEVKYIIENSDSRILFYSSEFIQTVKEVLKGCGALKKLICVDNPNPPEGAIYIDALKDYSKVEYPEVSREDLAVIIYTSGTTGRPKGAMLTHGNFLSNISSCLGVCKVSCRDRVSVLLPFFHSFTTTVCMLMPVSVGAGMVIIKSLHRFKKAFQRMLFRGVTLLIGIPQLYNVLCKVKLPWWKRWMVKVRLCISGAAPLPLTTLQEFEKNWKIPLVEGYGLSEASPVVSLNPVDGIRKAGSVGLPIPGVEVKVVDQDEAEVGTDQVGEVIVRGGNVMKGYYKDPASTAEAIRGGWLFTGDMGRIDKDGYIYIVDRKKDLILVHGLNVYPREIEEVIHQHPDVEECAVVGKPDPYRGEMPVVFVIPREGASLRSASVIAHCRKHLAEYKVPKQIFIMDELPRTPTGKILKRELRRMV